MNSSHREWATLNDCHVTQDNVFNKYLFKAKDGMYHDYVFTTRGEPEVIRMKEAGVEAAHNNCIRCHQDQVVDAKLEGTVDNHKANMTDRKCYKEVPHGKIRARESRV